MTHSVAKLNTVTEMIKKQILVFLRRFRGTYTEKQNYYNQLVTCIGDGKELSKFQKVHLQKLLMHAFQNVPFYAGRLRSILKNGISDSGQFSEIPLVTKSDILTYGKQHISNDIHTRKWFYNSSGGSTGEPVRFIQDELFDKWSEAVDRVYYENIIGIDEIAVKKIVLWGSERDIFEGTMGLKTNLMNWLTNAKLLNSFRMSENDMERYVRITNSYKPDLIRGYAGSLYEICKFIERKRLAIYRPKAIVSSAEKLRKEMREKIESVFGAKVYDYYGSREVAGIAGECNAGLMHIFMFNNYVEVLNERNYPAREGEMGKVVVTTLHNYSMPLIRFEIGDTVIPGPSKCKCGNPLPTLKEVSGRISDHFIREDRTLIHGEYFTHLFYLKDWLRAFQVVQEDYRKIRIFAALHGNINYAEKREIESKIRFVMGKSCNIIWEFVEEIPTTQSGKHIYVKSLVHYA